MTSHTTSPLWPLVDATRLIAHRWQQTGQDCYRQKARSLPHAPCRAHAFRHIVSGTEYEVLAAFLIHFDILLRAMSRTCRRRCGLQAERQNAQIRSVLLVSISGPQRKCIGNVHCGRQKHWREPMLSIAARGPASMVPPTSLCRQSRQTAAAYPLSGCLYAQSEDFLYSTVRGVTCTRLDSPAVF